MPALATAGQADAEELPYVLTGHYRVTLPLPPYLVWAGAAGNTLTMKKHPCSRRARPIASRDCKHHKMLAESGLKRKNG